MKKREQKKILKSMIDDVDTIHDLFDERLRSLIPELPTADHVRISTAIYELTGSLRQALILARTGLDAKGVLAGSEAAKLDKE